MAIGLIDCDKSSYLNHTSFCNLALMKIAGFYKDAEWFVHGKVYDKIYASKVFSFSPYELPPITNLEKGGNAFDMNKNLPDEIEHCKPRYSLYPDVNYSVGFYTRGCVKKCDFCIVHEKEGMLHRHSDLEEWVEPKFHKIICLDNNILANREFFEELYKEKIKKYPKKSIVFKQGMDKYYIDKDVVKMLEQINLDEPTIACDRANEIGVAKRCIDFLKPLNTRIFVYCLARIVDDLHTVVELANYDKRVFPYIMLYRDLNSDVRRNTKHVNQQLVWAKAKVNCRQTYYHLRKSGNLNYETLIAPPKETKDIRAELGGFNFDYV